MYIIRWLLPIILHTIAEKAQKSRWCLVVDFKVSWWQIPIFFWHMHGFFWTKFNTKTKMYILFKKRKRKTGRSVSIVLLLIKPWPETRVVIHCTQHVTDTVFFFNHALSWRRVLEELHRRCGGRCGCWWRWEEVSTDCLRCWWVAAGYCAVYWWQRGRDIKSEIIGTVIASVTARSFCLFVQIYWFYLFFVF